MHEHALSLDLCHVSAKITYYPSDTALCYKYQSRPFRSHILAQVDIFIHMKYAIDGNYRLVTLF